MWNLPETIGDGVAASGGPPPADTPAVPGRPPTADAAERLLSLTIAAPDLDPLAVLAGHRGRERFYWRDPETDEAIAGVGVAASLLGYGPSRFDDIAAQARALFRNAALPGTSRPRLFGGFAFSDAFTPDNTWATFYPAQFILPHYQITRRGDATTLTLNVLISADEDPAELIPELTEAAAAARVALTTAERTAPANPPRAVHYPMPRDAWRTLIDDATTAIRGSAFNKVVLSRVCELWFQADVDAAQPVRALEDAYPQSYRFLFEPQPFHAFYGASPELLVRVAGDALTTMALAGTAPRGETAAADAAIGRALLADPKNLHEHKLVVDALARRLKPLCTVLDVPAQPALMRLATLQHLLTPISGRLQKANGVLPLVEQLHPTPALGGQPRDAALPYINAVEPVPRGWYAAPVGVIDHTLDGVFCVAIRSAVTQYARVWLHAGAGIVGASDAEAEWNETGLKFGPMLRALDVADVAAADGLDPTAAAASEVNA